MGTGQGYPIAAEAYDFELFQLASTFAASTELARLSEKHQGIGQLRSTFERSEAARRLIAVAVMIRGKLDSRCVTYPGKLEETSESDVGLLVPDLEKQGDSKRLDFREACNKIIHATDVDLTPAGDDAESEPLLSQTVVLWGSRSARQGAKEWRADLDLPRFVDVASRL